MPHLMGTLQEALLKSGLMTEDRVKQLKEEEKKKKIAARIAAEKARAPKPKPVAKVAKKVTKAPPSKPAEKIHEHHLRTFCDACGKTSPDVEYYQHTNRRLDKYWLCVRCADENNIMDNTRQTHQSPQAQKKLFLRGYGATKVF